jgi:hypothetical protein
MRDYMRRCITRYFPPATLSLQTCSAGAGSAGADLEMLALTPVPAVCSYRQ